MIFYFVRHGETDWNVRKKIQGAVDIPLNENGRRQAEALAAQLLKKKKEGEFQVARAYTSPQLRAAETAKTAAEALGIQCVSLDGLREMGMGKWEGLNWRTVKTEFPQEYVYWNNNRRYVNTPEGESYNELLTRTFDALEYILRHEEKDVLVVTHSAVLMAVRCYLDGCPFKEREMLERYKIKNTEVVALSGEELGEAVKRFREEERQILS